MGVPKHLILKWKGPMRVNNVVSGPFKLENSDRDASYPPSYLIYIGI